MKHRKHSKPEIVLADPSKWSDASRRSVAVEWTREYRDIEYSCRRCRTRAIFSAADQKHAFEVMKAPISQQRVLCTECWRRSLVLERDIEHCEQQWAESRPQLSQDEGFLSRWLQLLTEIEAYGHRPNTAIKRMLAKLLGKLAEKGPADETSAPNS
jgi:hypothetical protein